VGGDIHWLVGSGSAVYWIKEIYKISAAARYCDEEDFVL
jgi:hypothetical protein